MTSAKPIAYNRLSIGLHWLTFLLFVAVYSTIELRELFPRGSDLRSAMKWWHASIGLSILAVAGLRLVVRLFARPRSPGETPAWQRALSGGTHLALYLLMIALPLIGWMMLSADGKPIPFFGVGLPPLISPNEGLAEQLEEVHETIGTLGYWLIGLHATAGLFHHYVLRDATLSRMLPART
ncbi:MAG TPA: cytochrome b [Sphingomicrobium sp.]|nr:cytochrome b [Sphingomicrobium sp.]